MYKRVILAALVVCAWLAAPSVACAQAPAKVMVYCFGSNIETCTPITPATPYTFLSTAAVQAASLKASAGIVWHVVCHNIGADDAFIRLYNQTGSPATGDGANVIHQFVIPKKADGGVGGMVFPNGLNFSAGIGIRVSEGIAAADATALNANEVTCSIGWQ